MNFHVKNLAAVALGIGLVSTCGAQSGPSATSADRDGSDPAPAAAPAAAPAPAPPAALPTPAITGPLTQLPPAVFDAGPLGKLAANGIVNGMGFVQGNHFAGDSDSHATLSNGQVFIQKPDGWWQFYVQAGIYDLPALGAPYLSADKTVSDLYGPVPVAYLKFQAGKNTSFEVGSLPTLMGAEYTFTFQNMNIERGLLWNQENAVNRGVQVNQTLGKFTASLSWNDGYYSNRYSWLSGALTYTNGPHSIAFVGMGNMSQTAFQTTATPVQNNSTMYALVYTYTKGSWIVQPYVQYSHVPTNPAIGIAKGASATGGALLLSHTFGHGLSLAGRWEYITASGRAADQAVNLLYGPGSAATSFTITPTYQRGGFFVRGEFAFVHATDYTPGSAFGPNGLEANQPRAVAEVGFLFGNNLTEHK